MPRNNLCGGCDYFDEREHKPEVDFSKSKSLHIIGEDTEEEPTQGLCRRYPPVLTSDGQRMFFRQPLTVDLNWCGEHVPLVNLPEKIGSGE